MSYYNVTCIMQEKLPIRLFINIIHRTNLDGKYRGHHETMPVAG